jgi:hypothetical protein
LRALMRSTAMPARALSILWLTLPPSLPDT